MFLAQKLFIYVIVLFSLLFFYFFNKYEKSRILRIEFEERHISTTLEKVKQITNCFDKPLKPQILQRGKFLVLSNYIVATTTFKCHESITITTQGDFTFLDNLIPMVARWRGPISVALYAPGTDFTRTVTSIGYLRDCTTNLIKKLVTFHIFFDSDHTPEKIALPKNVDCSSPPAFNVTSTDLYKNRNKLLYPINVGRNVAREMSQTYFVLAIDIELYPNPGIILRFLEMIARNEGPLLKDNPRVFPLAVFEVKSGEEIPESKTELKKMLKEETAISFHKSICSSCHEIPQFNDWVKRNVSDTLNIFTIRKRVDQYKHWEPFYIGTNSEPFYDERLSWEGKRNKMTNGFLLCVLDYDLMVLDNAFLVHRPGIKKYKKNNKRQVLVRKANDFIRKRILQEMKLLFGFKRGCVV